MSQTFQYDYNGQMHTTRLERQPDGTYIAHIGGEAIPFAARPLPDGGWHIALAEATTLVHSAAAGDQRVLQSGGQTYTLTRMYTAPGRGRMGFGWGVNRARRPGPCRAQDQKAA